VTFTAQSSPGARYTWLFGDGSKASGRRVTHRFPDAEEQNSTGQETARAASGFCCMLTSARAALIRPIRTGPRREWWPWLIGMKPQARRVPCWPVSPGISTWRMDRVAEPRRRTRGFLRRKPQRARGFAGLYALRCCVGRTDRHSADGGYTFHFLSRDGARLVIDGVEVAKTGRRLRRFAARRATRCVTIAARWVARGQTHISSGGLALGQPGIAKIVVGRPRTAAD